MISKGKIRITRNGQTERTTKPHFIIRPGDALIFMRGTTLLQVEMISAAQSRGPASEAAALYAVCENP